MRLDWTVGVWLCGACWCAFAAAEASRGERQAAVQSGATSVQAPAIKVTTRLVQLSVVAEDRKGRPVEGLKREDFELLDNGKPQNIALFANEEDLQKEIASGDAEARTRPAGNVFENRTAPEAGTGTITVILFDALNTPIRDQLHAKQELLAFLRQLKPQDHVAVYLLTRRLRVIHEFTQDAQALLEAVERLQTELSLLETNASQPPISSADTGIPDQRGARRLARMMNEMTSSLSDLANVDRVQITAQALEAVANHVSGIPGRKNLIWVSGSFPSSIALSRADNSPVDMQSQNFSGRLAQVSRAMSQADVAIYPVDARGLMMPGDLDAGVAHPEGAEQSEFRNITGTDEQGMMRTLAERTGGRAFINNNDIQGAIRMTLAETRHSYLLGFYPDHGQWDGKFRELKLRAKKGGVSLKYRRGYFALADAAGAGEARSSLQMALWSPVDASGVGLRVRLEAIDLASRKVDLRVGVELRALRLVESGERRTGMLDAVLVQLGASDVALAAEPLTYTLDMSQKEYENALQRGYELKAALAIRRETRTVRVIVRDAGSGELGSVTVPMGKFLPPAPGGNAGEQLH